MRLSIITVVSLATSSLALALAVRSDDNTLDAEHRRSKDCSGGGGGSIHTGGGNDLVATTENEEHGWGRGCDEPKPGEGVDKPKPGEGEKPKPGGGEKPKPGEGEKPKPGEGEKPKPPPGGGGGGGGGGKGGDDCKGGALKECKSMKMRTKGSVSGSVGQLGSGQLRIGLESVTLKMEKGEITDGKKRGCWWTPPTQTLQCDVGQKPEAGFEVGCDGRIKFKDQTRFFQCEADNQQYNIYLKGGQGVNCAEITLYAEGCREGSGGGGGGGGKGGEGGKENAPPPNNGTSIPDNGTSKPPPSMPPM